jgi:uncharacterized protein
MERHNLLHEFPELQDKIHQLKTTDAHFKRLFEEYDEVEHQVYRINTGAEVTTDEHAHELKAKLLHLKDDIYSRIK